MASSDDYWSCRSFAVGFRAELGKLSPNGRAVVLKALTDPTPGLCTFLSRDSRDRWIRELATLYGGKPTPTAKRIADRLGRYLTGAWKRERDVGPAEGAGQERQLLYLIAHAGAGASLSDRAIFEIICKNEVCPGATS